MLSRSSSRSQPLPEKISLLLQEARWLILGVVSLYVGMVLVGYNEADPGWSTLRRRPRRQSGRAFRRLAGRPPALPLRHFLVVVGGLPRL